MRIKRRLMKPELNFVRWI